MVVLLRIHRLIVHQQVVVRLYVIQCTVLVLTQIHMVAVVVHVCTTVQYLYVTVIVRFQVQDH